MAGRSGKRMGKDDAEDGFGKGGYGFRWGKGTSRGGRLRFAVFGFPRGGVADGMEREKARETARGRVRSTEVLRL
ncbi:hypothetical protein E2562_032401 [Oryza meyeriana var. granulata]|uniref:Uncharacterized protein n=1 Tax=Oryza meyeriana var. granulata TaxID=110450 RepID=A0A6G1CUI7_9ORYZ|nr:hypothetical protein E2562_032401 [Oryza meyeriana var. granulata]